MKQFLWKTTQLTQQEFIGASPWRRHAVTDITFERQVWHEYQRRGISEKVLVPICHKDRLLYYHQQKKFKPAPTQKVRFVMADDFQVQTDSYVFDNVYAENYWSKEEILVVEIENLEIAKMQRSILHFLWDRSLPWEEVLKNRKK